ncbi:MAG: DUF808 domain-containing protein [Crocinitomicaceae bacterium]
MASGFFALFDDIAALMDDVAVMGKVAAKKTAGILGDDLAVNAEKSSGFLSSREIPVLWAIGKGSLLNKAIILPIAFALSAFYPPAITVILILGGGYLAYEGAEKIVEFFFHKPTHQATSEAESPLTEVEILAAEKGKIKSAIVTDFILSIEIVIIALGAVVGEPIVQQILVVSIIAIVATVGVYGIVAFIVRMDDMGLAILRKTKKESGFNYLLGKSLVNALPWVIKGLSVIGTLALLLVAGGIFVHNLTFFHTILPSWPSTIKDFVIGLSIGLMAVFTMALLKFIWRKIKK